MEAIDEQHRFESALVSAADVAQRTGVERVEKSGGNSRVIFGVLNSFSQRPVFLVEIEALARDDRPLLVRVGAAIIEFEPGALAMQPFGAGEVGRLLSQRDEKLISAALEMERDRRFAFGLCPSVLEQKPGLLTALENHLPRAAIFMRLAAAVSGLRYTRVEFVTAFVVDQQHAGPLRLVPLRAAKSGAVHIAHREAIVNRDQIGRR